MLRKDLQTALEKDQVSNDIIQAGFLAYDYLNSFNRNSTPAASTPAAYSWEIADAVLGTPTMGWSTSRLKLQTALALFENRGIFEQRKNDLKYIIQNILEE